MEGARRTERPVPVRGDRGMSQPTHLRRCPPCPARGGGMPGGTQEDPAVRDAAGCCRPRIPPSRPGAGRAVPASPGAGARCPSCATPLAPTLHVPGTPVYPAPGTSFKYLDVIKSSPRGQGLRTAARDTGSPLPPACGTGRAGSCPRSWQHLPGSSRGLLPSARAPAVPPPPGSRGDGQVMRWHRSWCGDRGVRSDGQPLPAASVSRSARRCSASVSLGGRRCCAVPRRESPARAEGRAQLPTRPGVPSSPKSSAQRPWCHGRDAEPEPSSVPARAGWGQTGPRGDRRLRGGGGGMQQHSFSCVLPHSRHLGRPFPDPSRHHRPSHPPSSSSPSSSSSSSSSPAARRQPGGMCALEDTVWGRRRSPPRTRREGLTCTAALGTEEEEEGGISSPARPSPPPAAPHPSLPALCGGRQLRAPGAARKEAAFKQQT